METKTVDMKDKLPYTKPTMPAWVHTAAEEDIFFKRHNLHRCVNPVDIPNSGIRIRDCIEDLIGRFFVRTKRFACQVVYCPICGKKARSQP